MRAAAVVCQNNPCPLHGQSSVIPSWTRFSGTSAPAHIAVAPLLTTSQIARADTATLRVVERSPSSSHSAYFGHSSSSFDRGEREWKIRRAKCF